MQASSPELMEWPPLPGAIPVSKTAAAEIPEPADNSLAGLASRIASAAQAQDTGIKLAAVGPELWRVAEAHPLVLLIQVLDRYGEESFDWAPEVLRATMLRDGIDPSGANWTKILAARVLVQSPSPWRQWEVFHWVCCGLSGKQPNITYLEMPVIGNLMAGLDMMKIVDPSRVTSVEVDKFIAATLRDDGQVFAPETLGTATRELEDPQLHCKHCGALHRDDSDQKCISCGEAALEKVPYVFAELRDQCQALWKARRDLILEKALDGLPETSAGNLVYHLMVHWDYARRMQQRLLQQLRAIAR
jgi:hypothetical protein